MYWFLLSWQSIIAGVITVLAVSIIMAVLGVALGFTVVKPTSDHPLSGLGTTFGLWGAFSILVSLAAGGFVSGMFSGAAGMEHGFLVWATSLIVAALFSSAAIGAAVRTMGSAARTVGSGAATAAGAVGGVVGDGVHSLAASVASSASEHLRDLKDSIHLDYDFHDLGDDVTSVLRDTGEPTLQPDYLKGQMREAKSDLRSAIRQLHLNVDNYQEVITTFLNKEKGRLDSITGDVDRETAVNALMKQRDMSREEADKAICSALKAYDHAVDKARASLDYVQDEVEDAVQHVKTMSDNARIRADKMASTAAKSALAAALALILGALVCSYFGLFGARLTADRTTAMLRERGVGYTWQAPEVTELTVITPVETN